MLRGENIGDLKDAAGNEKIIYGAGWENELDLSVYRVGICYFMV